MNIHYPESFLRDDWREMIHTWMDELQTHWNMYGPECTQCPGIVGMYVASHNLVSAQLQLDTTMFVLIVHWLLFIFITYIHL